MKNLGTKTIETQRLILRKFRLEDKEMMLKNWISDFDIQNNYGEPIYCTKKAVNKVIKKWLIKYKEKNYYRWAIITKDSEENIGQIAFCKINFKLHSAELEYCIGKKFQNKGYATEALSGVLNFVFTKTKFHRISAFHRNKNKVSGEVMKKAGMLYEGTFKESIIHENEYDDTVHYGITRNYYYHSLQMNEPVIFFV